MHDNLTPREIEAARKAAAGASNKAVASSMGLSEGTVEQYLHRAYEKLGCRGRGDLQYTLPSCQAPESPK